MADADALFTSARQCCARHHCGQAVAFWEQASSIRPADPDIHYQLGFCYAGGCGTHDLLDPAVAIFHYRRALALSPRENIVGRAMVLGALGNAYVSAARTGAQLLSAIRCYEEAARTFAQIQRLDDWAREEFNLGNAWCEMPEDDFPEKWRRAVEHFERALSVRTRLKDSRHYVATLQNLGTAYRELKSGDRGANIRRAIECYHRAMRALREIAPDRKRADLHHNLGNAYLSLAAFGNDGVRNIRRAIRHFVRALSGRPKELSPFDYAAAQYGLGQAFLRLAECGAERVASLGEARSCFAEAAEAFSECGQSELADKVRQSFSHAPICGGL